EVNVDFPATAGGVRETRRPRVSTSSTHGTGCTLSSALAALAARERLAGRQLDWAPLVDQARDYLQAALEAGESLGVGSGHGPVHHFAGRW
ncbi:bifunctional hydroxymethylpyrimidine kinase/phosphomethylpyrimidine kinase, partial [Modestobacter marinus]|uniref:bifunctional hydroxymethylpyrimidine kinase/phosphomethylpyrimidine kinase n=1 Tax=Modestobacter marinus TaxID=477641 RepID=UPI00201B320E